MAQGQVVNISEASSGDPYRLRKPVFEFADKRARDYNVDTRSAPEILRSIEQQNAEILQNLGTLNEGAAEEVASCSQPAGARGNLAWVGSGELAAGHCSEDWEGALDGRA